MPTADATDHPTPPPPSNNQTKLVTVIGLVILAITAWLIAIVLTRQLGITLLTQVQINWPMTAGLLLAHSLSIASLAIAILLAQARWQQLLITACLPLVFLLTHPLGFLPLIIALLCWNLISFYLATCHSNLKLFRKLKLSRITNTKLSLIFLGLSLMSSYTLYQQFTGQEQLIVTQINQRFIQPISQSILQSQASPDFLKSWGSDLSVLWDNPTLKQQVEQLTQQQKAQVNQELQNRWTSLISPISSYLDEILVIGLALIYYQIATFLKILPVLLIELIFNFLKFVGIIKIKQINMPVEIIV